ncbi:hypothetical protein [Pedobacter agri]|uniref:hypothetical protein n=1 Tax=Pedobacter agri TaxID=454586 RepID=UPI00292F7101|nr:hypothetical protein [Pedobacter agri]
MKTITKIIATSAAVVALFFTTNVNAQSKKLGIGVNVGAGTNDAYGLAIGGDLRYQFDVDKQLSIPVTAGYTHLVGKDIEGTNLKFSDYGYIPVKIGAKYFFDTTGSGLYGLAEVGAGFGVTPSNAGTGFIYSPAIGYSWSNGIDLSAKYEGNTAKPDFAVNPQGWFGIRLAYGFSL